MHQMQQVLIALVIVLTDLDIGLPRSRATVVILCDYINNPLLLSIPHKLNLGGTLRTTNYVL